MPPPIVTRRLRGLPLAESDLPDLHALHRDERVMESFGGVSDSEDDETREWLEEKLAHWREHGFGVWVFRDPGGAFVGRCGIHRCVVVNRPEVELGYIVRSELWSQGYGTEMAEAVAAHAFSELRLDELVAFTAPGNLPSRRVLEKAGFRYELTYVKGDRASVLYRLVGSLR